VKGGPAASVGAFCSGGRADAGGLGGMLVEALTVGGLVLPSTISTVPQRLQVILTRLPKSFSSATP
jgi:hypothetical protein